MKNHLLFVAPLASFLLVYSARAAVVDTVLSFDTNTVTSWTPVDLNGDGTNDFSFNLFTFCFNRFSSGSTCYPGLDVVGDGSNQLVGGSGGSALPLHLGATIAPDPMSGAWIDVGGLSSFGILTGPSVWDEVDPPGTVTGLGTPGSGNYMGVKFLIGSDWHYGWIRFGPVSNPQSPVPSSSEPSVLEFAYETIPDTPIVAGPQPNPTVARGPVRFRLQALMQDSYYAAIGQTIQDTNLDSAATNIISVFKSNVARGSIGSASILGLLENSFATNFPAGAKLMMAGTGRFSFFVVDRSGSNVLLDAGSVLSIADNVSVNAGHETLIRTETASATRVSGKDQETFTEYADLAYDDVGLATRDGTHTDFDLKGILVQKRSTDVATGRFREAITLKGAGTGTVRGRGNIVLKGILTGKVSGSL